MPRRRGRRPHRAGQGEAQHRPVRGVGSDDGGVERREPGRPDPGRVAARRAALCNRSTTYTVDCWRNRPRGYGTRRSTRPGRRQNVWPPGPAHRRSPRPRRRPGHPDRDPGWPPWPTPRIQTRTIASTAPRATSPAPSPTSPGHGWRHRPSQPLQSRTASSVLTTSTPASSRPSATCTRPWPATPDDLAGLLADMKPVWVVVGGVGGGALLHLASTQTGVLHQRP
jgi:hypothetical protein